MNWFSKQSAITPQDHDGVVVMLQTCIRELLGSNLGWDLNYLTVVPAGELQDSPSICPQQFPFQIFSVHQYIVQML
jgi:hypothetical protein